MPKHTLLKAVTTSLSLALISTSLLAAPVNSNMNWKLGVGINIDNITKADSSFQNGKYFESYTQSTSDLGYTLSAVKPVTNHVSFRVDYVSVGKITQKDKNNNGASIAATTNQFVNLLGQYAYPIFNNFDMYGTAGIVYNINKTTPNNAALETGPNSSENSSLGVAYGVGLQYHAGAATIALTDMQPTTAMMTNDINGYVTLDFLYQL